MSTIEQLYIDSAGASLPEANCLPFSLYREEAVYQLEKEKIFQQDWVFVCAENQLSKAGDYVALTIADEPTVVIRGQDGQLRALSNVCRHRGTLLNDEGVGQVKRMVCPYHAWTYADDGKLVGAPFAEPGEVDKQAHCLPRFALEIWQGLVFVNLTGDAEPLVVRYACIEPYLALYQSSQFDTYYPGITEQWQCNWKLAMENAMESYHLFKVHTDTLETVTPTKQAFYMEGGANYSLTGGKYQGNDSKLAKWLLGEGSAVEQHYILIALPPSFVAILSAESLAWISVLPTGKSECEVRSGALSVKGSVSQSEAEFTAAFFAEDKMICERVQKGMAANVGRGGSLIEMERVVVDFHRYLASRIAGEVDDKVYRAEESVFSPHQK